MGGFIAARAEVVGRFDDSAAEELLPDPVHGHSRRERIVLRTSHFARSSRLATRRSCRHRRQHRRRVRFHFDAQGPVIAANAKVSSGGAVADFAIVIACGQLRIAGVQLLQLLVELIEFQLFVDLLPTAK